MPTQNQFFNDSTGSEMTAKQQVLKMYPDAFIERIDYGYAVFENQTQLSKWLSLGHSKFEGCSIEQAWQNALNNIENENSN